MRIALALTIVCASCKPDLHYPSPIAVSCGSDADCPDRYACRGGMCFVPSSFDTWNILGNGPADVDKSGGWTPGDLGVAPNLTGAP